MLCQVEHQAQLTQHASISDLLSDCLLQGCYCKGFHNCPCWLCLDLDLLTKGHALSSLGGWFVARLDHAYSRNRELTSAFDLFASKLSRSIQGFCHFRSLLLTRCRQCISNSTL